MGSRKVLNVVLGLMLVLPTQAADLYRIDSAHSEIGFRIRHLVSKTAGRFPKFEGTIMVDEKEPSKSSVTVTIDVSSISTDVEARDKHLRSPDFFDVAKYPTITFKSTRVVEVAKGKVEVTGDFSMHGITRSIILPITSLGAMAGPKPGTVIAGFEGNYHLNRNDYGINAYPHLAGDDVEITLSVEALKVPSAK